MMIFSKVFMILAVLLSDIMCATVAYNYCNILWEIRYAGTSAPAEVAFVLAIPFVIAITVCLTVSVILKKKSIKQISD